jgi:hypothetical protein
MGQRLAALLVALAVGRTMPAWAGTQSDDERTSRKVLALFEGHSDETIDAFLMRLRPAPLDEASRAKVIASLPTKGEVRPSRKDGEKLSAAQRILDYSARPGAISIKVIEVDSAFVGLYYRTVVLVSAKALALLSSDELAALVAHEMGHDADWNDYWAATQAHDSARMRELELKADGLGVLTLEHLGIDPEHLVSAVQKMMRYNEWQDRSAGATPQTNTGPVTGDRYVSLEERLAFIHAVAKLKWADTSPPTRAASALRFHCNEGFSVSTCEEELARLRDLLAHFDLRSLGQWTWILVRSEDWKPILRQVGRDPDSPAFTILAARQTFLEEALFAPDPPRSRTFLERFSMPLEQLLPFAVAHELAHALCREANERRTDRYATQLRQTGTTSCRE